MAIARQHRCFIGALDPSDHIEAVAVFAWSRTALVSGQASPAASITVGIAPARAANSMPPTDMMMNYKGPLVAEQWDAI